MLELTSADPSDTTVLANDPIDLILGVYCFREFAPRAQALGLHLINVRPKKWCCQKSKNLGIKALAIVTVTPTPSPE